MLIKGRGYSASVLRCNEKGCDARFPSYSEWTVIRLQAASVKGKQHWRVAITKAGEISKNADAPDYCPKHRERPTANAGSSKWDAAASRARAK